MRPPVAEHIQTLKPYVPGKPIEETERELGITGVIKLASNENPLGPSPKAVAAMVEAVTRVHLYPDGASFKLIERLSRHLEVGADQLVVGSGSNELIELLIRTFTTPEDEVLFSAGSFIAYKVSAQSHGRPWTEIPMAEGFRYDLPAIAAAISSKTRLVFLANPDNPTGTMFPKEALEAFLEEVPEETLVVLDEAYYEYVEDQRYQDGLALVAARPNVIVLRTFSKIYGLAGVRLGYGVMRPELAAYLQRTRMPFNVTSVAQAAGLAALDDIAHVEDSRKLNRLERGRVAEALRGHGLEVPESHANFVFCDLGRPAQPFYEGLLRRGVITRPMGGYGHPNAIRISIGLNHENGRLLEAFEEELKA